MDWTEAERLRRDGKYTQKNYTKKTLNDPNNHNGVVTHLEPDIFWVWSQAALESMTIKKAKGGVGTPAELLKILKNDAVKVPQSKCQQI